MALPTVPPPPADPTAVFGRRVVAALIDGALVTVPYLLAVSSSFEYLDLDGARDGSDYCTDYIDVVGGFCFNAGDTVYFSDDLGGGGLNGLFLLVGLLLAVVVQGLTGATVGKALLGLRLVRADGRRPGIGRALLRHVLWLVDGLPCLGLVGFITGLTTTGHRRVGDLAAGTFVVGKASAGRPLVIPGLTPPGGAPVPPPGDPWAGAPAPAPGWPAPPAPSWPAPPTDAPTTFDEPAATPPPPAPDAVPEPEPEPDPARAPAPAPEPAPATPATTAAEGTPAPPVVGPPSAGPAAAHPTPTAQEGPQWDEARGTYIQWDPEARAWMQWDDGTKVWVPIR